MDVRDLISYNHTVRRLYFDSLAKLPWSEVVKPRGASFDSLRDVFLHLTLVEDRWINYAIPDRLNLWIDLVFDDFTDVESIKTYMLQVEERTQKFLQPLSVDDLNRQIIVPWEKNHMHA